MKTDLEMVLNLRPTIGEGLSWDPENGVLYWIDIIQGKLHLYYPNSKVNDTICLGQFVGCAVPRERGGVILAMQHGIFFLDTVSGRLSPITDPESELPNNRFNDGKCDCAGRFWAGTMSNAENEGKGDTPPAGTLYLLDTNLQIKPVLRDVTISNGIGWSADNTVMYFIDTPTGKVFAFDFDAQSGEISDKRVAVTLPEGEGFPDGMCVDSEGMLWVAQWGGYGVSRWDPATGTRLRKIDVPVKNVSSCAFGGRDLDELYITTATLGSESETGDMAFAAGGLFRIRPGVKGLKTFKFRG